MKPALSPPMWTNPSRAEVHAGRSEGARAHESMDVQPQLLLLSGDDLPRFARADGLPRAWNSGQRPDRAARDAEGDPGAGGDGEGTVGWPAVHCQRCRNHGRLRSEEHTSELQSHLNIVCRLLLEKKKIRH